MTKMTKMAMLAFMASALFLLGACTKERPSLYPMNHDNLVTCQKQDGSRYEVDDGDCHQDIQVFECWLPQGGSVFVPSAKECAAHGGRRSPPLL